MESSKTRDYDGDGNLIEGVYYEIDGLRTKLLTAIQEYANEELGMPIIYDSGSYPYWFNDNGEGANADPDRVTGYYVVPADVCLSQFDVLERDWTNGNVQIASLTRHH